MLALVVAGFCHKFEASFRKHVLSNQSSCQSNFFLVFTSVLPNEMGLLFFADRRCVWKKVLLPSA